LFKFSNAAGELCGMKDLNKASLKEEIQMCCKPWFLGKLSVALHVN